VIQFLLVLAGFVFVAFRIYKEAAETAVTFRKPVRTLVHDSEVRKHLQQIDFFRKLNAEDQRIFVERVQYFLKEKDYQGMDGQVITDEIRTIVAASAVQISFRLTMWKFPSFHTFRIYPESFYSNLFRKYLKGGAGRTGQIWFSLRDYRDGYAHPDNGINLGLHEMAHAVIIEMENGNLDDQFTNAYEVIEKLANNRIPKIRSGTFTYLRGYAGTNEMEFIAVTTEYFFEQPEKLSAADRELYEAFAQLYNQNPVPATSTDLKITAINYEELEKEVVKRNYRFAKWHWSLTLALLGIFIAPFFLAGLSMNVALSFSSMWIVAVIVLFASSVFLYKPIVKSGALGVAQFWLLHTFGMWPLMLALFYLVNNFIPVWQQGDAHRVSKIYWDTRYKAVVSFSDGAYADDSNLRTVFVKEEKQLSVGDYVIVVTQYGPFGVPVYSKNIVVRVPP
jgi:Mlc titration factor MtfA (ptsG expression regulator)